MGQITQDGYTFNSDWIDHRIAMLTDGNIPRDVRRYKLLRELEAHKSAMKCMPEMMPNDHAAMAHAKAYLAALVGSQSPNQYCYRRFCWRST